MSSWPIETIDSEAYPVQYRIVTTCPNCLEDHHVGPFSADQIDQYRADEQKIQHIFPEMSADDRERLISGCCPECWDELFLERSDYGDEDEEAEMLVFVFNDDVDWSDGLCEES